MRMIIRQVSDLDQRYVVSERHYQDENPTDVAGIFDLVLANCSDFISNEGIEVEGGIAAIKMLTLEYPGMAGQIEIAIGTDEEGQSILWAPNEEGPSLGPVPEV